MTTAGIAITEMIQKMPKEEFRERLLEGICRTAEFGHLVSAGADDLSVAEKKKIVGAIIELTHASYEYKDQDLDTIANAIVERSVRLV